MQKKQIVDPKTGRWVVIFCLIFAAEMIFGLPFHVVRYFRPTFLEVFNLTNTQLGDAMAVYGITAMLSYFPGGLLADRFSAKYLMSLSLVATGLGGLYLISMPGLTGLTIVFGYWGVTTIFLFWSAMMKTTREWGGKLAQGRAFGILDGGRGLMAAIVASLAVFVLAFFLPDENSLVNEIDRLRGFKAVVLFYSLMTFIAALLVHFFIPHSTLLADSAKVPFKLKSVILNRSAWLQALIVVCAYSGYRGLDFYGIYGIEFLEMEEVSSARFVSNAAYLRVIGAIGAGFVADRITTKKTIVALFAGLLISYIFLSSIVPTPQTRWLILGNLVITFLAVYALRGVYFALFEEMNIAGRVTGTTVGLVSLVGYTPDVFFNSVAGRIIEASPGITGYQHYYLFLCAFALTGLISSLLLIRHIAIQKARS